MRRSCLSNVSRRRKLARMIILTADESRVLGVLVEKALTTPDQYPLSLNAIVNGANQKNNRYPVLAMTEQAAFDAAEGLERSNWPCGSIKSEDGCTNIGIRRWRR